MPAESKSGNTPRSTLRAENGGSKLPHSTGTLAAVQRYFEVSLYSLIVTSVLTLVATGKLDPVSTFIPPVLVAVKGWRWWRGRGPELSHRAATWLTVLYLIFFPFDLFVISRMLAHGAPNPLLYASLLAAIHLMLFAMLVRLYSASTTRDYLFLTMTAFALMLVTAILTVDTIYLGFFLVFLVLAVSTFVGLEMRRSSEGAVAPPLAAGTPQAQRLQRALSWTSTTMAFGALALGALIFLVIPRVTAGYLSGLNLQPTLISGFSDDVELGQIGTIKQSKAVVMRVRVEGEPGTLGSVKWRGIALTTFDGKRWFSAAKESPQNLGPDNQGWYYMFYRDTKNEEISAETWQQLLEARRSGAAPPLVPPRQLRYTVLLEPLATNTLFVAHLGVGLRGRFAPEIVRGTRASRGSYLQMDWTSSVTNPNHSYQRVLYEGLSAVAQVPAERLRSHQIGYSDLVKQRYLQLPPLDPRIEALARQITANAPTAFDKAAAIEQHLRTRFGYTLDLSGTPPDDPLAHFLFERRAGHCEYFAAAMTVMLRTQGIPARYVNGFLPGEYNDVGEDYIVRASDAHSWVEVFFGEYGWIPFDPTPPADTPPSGFLGRLLFYYDWFELAWSEYVINYDLNRQVTLAQTLQRASREWTLETQEYLRQKRRAAIDWLKETQAALTAAPHAWPIGVALLAGIALLLSRHGVRDYLARQWGLRFAADAELTPRLATLHYRQMLKLLARRGFAKSPGQTPAEFAQSIPAAELAGPVGQLTELYQSARFGARPSDAHQMATLLGMLKLAIRNK
jgi:transglutaminase-like putative cysteine protease